MNSSHEKYFKAGSFAPIVSKQSRILILGTMPGIASLEKQEYYGHPRNLFWEFLFRIFETDFSEKYDDRKKLITENQLALWDVLGFCEREGSLDSNIKNEEPNDILGLLATYPSIEKIVFNGKGAENFFRKHIKPRPEHVHILQMPSTSPANASIPKETKFAKWKSILL